MTQRMEIVLWVLVFVWMCVIFSFSAQGGTSSGGFSAVFARMVASVLTPGFDGLDAAGQAEAISHYQLLVRKSGHFWEYAMLGGLMLNALRYTWQRHGHPNFYKHPIPKLALMAWAFCILYASSDEIHQLFVPGRCGAWTDVVIDSCGALLGVLIAWLILRHRLTEDTTRKRAVALD